jgi:hypothetical protein
MFMSCGVLAQPRRQLAGVADGVVPKASVDQQVDSLASLRKLSDFASDETDHWCTRRLVSRQFGDNP